MATFQERFDEQQEPLKNNDRATDTGRKEQVDYANRGFNEGNDDEDMEDLDSLKGKIPNPPQKAPDYDNDSGI